MWLKKHFSDFIELFDAYPFKIQKIDAARYFILYHFGGVYMDLDIGCFSTKDIGDIVSYMEASDKHVALPLTSPVGLSNDVMIAIKNSLFFKKAILSLQSKNRWFGAHYLTVLYSTGSMFLSLLYFQQNPPERSVVAIIPPRLYSEKGTRYFQHFRGSTWHGKDALFIQWIVRYWCAIVPFFIAFMLLRRITCIRSNTKENKLKQ
jgi:mannosyltransferase OCH1-like enzyme